MSERWPLGPEVTRTSVERGAMLYDSSRAGNLDLQWFDVRYWESQNAIEGDAKGRGRARFINAPGLKLVLRSYRRGGLIARLFSRKSYVWKGEDRTRPFREWQLTYRMHRAGLPVAAPIAARYRRRFGLYTGELLTERLAVKGTVADCLMKDPLSVLTWVAIGRCIRRFHDFGVCHADLNLRNILVGDDDAIYLIDFDRCSLRKPGLWRDSNLVRLRRSLEKVTYGLPPDRFTEADWHALLDGYRQSAPKPQPVTGFYGPATSPPAASTSPAAAAAAAPAAAAPAPAAAPAHPAATVVMPSPAAPTVVMPAPITQTVVIPSPFAPTEEMEMPPAALSPASDKPAAAVDPPPAGAKPAAPAAPPESSAPAAPAAASPGVPAAPAAPAAKPKSGERPLAPVVPIDPSQAVTLLRAPRVSQSPVTLMRGKAAAPPAQGSGGQQAPPSTEGAPSAPAPAAGKDAAAASSASPRKESAP